MGAAEGPQGHKGPHKTSQCSHSLPKTCPCREPPLKRIGVLGHRRKPSAAWPHEVPVLPISTKAEVSLIGAHWHP
eukprot:s458_g12.t1